MVKITPETVLYTADCDSEAITLRSYCESKFPIGEPTTGAFSVTGEPYIALTHSGCSTIIGAREHAQDAFDAYAKDKSGIFYWRVIPEIALMMRNQRYGYYMRLLISDKPRKL